MSLRGILLFCLLVIGFEVFGQSISVFPTTVNKGQAVTFYVSGTNTDFTTVSGCHLQGQGQYLGSYGIPQSPTSMTTTINIPVSVPTGNYTFSTDGGFNYVCPTPITVLGPVNSGLVNGRVTRNTFCSGGQSMANQVVEFLPGPHYAITDAYGNYSQWLPLGSYTVGMQAPLNHTQLCPASTYPVTLTNSGQVVNNQNFYFEQQAVVDVGVNIVSNIHRPGFTTTNYVVVENFGGSTASNVTVKLTLDSLINYQSSMPTAVQNMNTLTWTILSLPPNAQVLLYFNVNTPTNTLGFPLRYDAESITTGDVNVANNTHHRLLIISGSYDPNDKQVWVRDSVVADGPINPTDSVLRYLVRFQNTGTDTAFNIFIRDTLDSNLDPGSLQILHASHNYYYSLTNGNQFEFFFPNILLPDSNANEPLSHGHIEFSFKRKPNLPVGTEIDNTAHIYFDFNVPVVTNTVTSKICPPVNLDFNISTNSTTISIVNNSSGNLGSVLWDLGDGNTSTAFSPNHTYSAAGLYNVCLTVTDTCGVRSLCQLVSATCASPTADFGFTSNGNQTQFSDQSLGNIVTWAWDFGDGNTSTVASPTHVYANGGLYTACLVVTTDCGSMDTTCYPVLVVGIQDSPFQSVDLYPNPSDGRFSLQANFSENGLLKAEVRDMTGRILYAGNWGEVQGQFKKNMEMELPAGSYFLQLELNGRTVSRMFNVR